jgi:hypothetical protein
MNFHSELDDSPTVDAKGVGYYHTMTGSLNWAIALGRHDIQHAVSALSEKQAGHIGAPVVMTISGYLKYFPANQLAIADHMMLPFLVVEKAPCKGAPGCIQCCCGICLGCERIGWADRHCTAGARIVLGHPCLLEFVFQSWLMLLSASTDHESLQ